MAQTVTDRMRVLGAQEFFGAAEQEISISTLADYGRNLIGLDENNVIDKDAQKTKEFQLDQVKEALRFAMKEDGVAVTESNLLRQVSDSADLFEVFAQLVMAEISTVIKGRGYTGDKNRYVNAEVPLSRLHRILTPRERSMVFDCFRRYNEIVFEEYEMLDTDDLALTLEGRLRTPFWNLKRKTEAFDFVFVDEVQLFNENERRIFPFLTKDNLSHVPIALALDEAQEPFGFAAAGLATLGIADVESENLPSNHRSTKEIVDLAFFIIQQTTDLFGSEFPDFSDVCAAMIPSQGSGVADPIIVTCNEEAKNYGRYLVKLVQKLRARNVRQIAVICHAESYWEDLVREFSASELPLHVIAQRGERITPDQPLVVLSRPNLIGGQEFDAAVIVGLEEGLVPPRVKDNPPLAAALEQQTLREIYLSVSRARYRVLIALNKGAHPNRIVNEALANSLITTGTVL
jgi:superfamily I DNA/RNA helicase